MDKKSIMAIFALSALFLVSTKSIAENFFRFIEFKGEDGISRVGKWGEPTLGEPAKVSYHILEEEYSFDVGLDMGRCKRMVPLRNALKLSGMSRATFEREAEKAFDGWSRVTNVTFVTTASLAEADVVIGTLADQKYSSDKAFTNIETKLLRDGDIVTFTKAVVCLNPLLEWRVVSPNTEEMPSVRRALEHEIGHVLGLEHTSEEDPPIVMSYRYLGDVPFTETDIKMAQFLYGVP